MKNLRITESCLVRGSHTEAGTVLRDVDNSTAADLIMNGRAVIVKESAPGIVIQNQTPAVENRDPKPAGKTKSGKAKDPAPPAPDPVPEAEEEA